MKACKRKPYMVEMTPAPIKYVELQVKEGAEEIDDDGNVTFVFKFTTGAIFKQKTTKWEYEYWKEIKAGDILNVCLRGPRMMSIHRC